MTGNGALAEETLEELTMATQKHPSRLTQALLETADDMRRSGVIGTAARDKITMRHLGEVAEPVVEPMSGEDIRRVQEILATVKPLAAEYYRLTGKPLGITGEVAEYVAAELLGLTLAPARTPGYDALRGTERIQIKGRAYGKDAKPGQRMSRMKVDAPCDIVLLVVLDNATLEPRELWEAPFPSVAASLARPGSKARERGALGVSEFKRIARRIWPKVPHVEDQAKGICPECGHQFRRNGFDGIDAHWRAKHDDVMPYEEAWPLIKSVSYANRRKE